MKFITDQAVLLIYCFTSLLLVDVNTPFITAFLTSIIYIPINLPPGRRWYHIASAAAWILFAACIPEALHFYPVILYSMFSYKDYIGIFLSGLLCLFHLIQGSVPQFFLLMLGSLLAFVLYSRTTDLNKLEAKFKITRDDSTELNLLLKEKNQSLLEKQDYEIYTATLKERNRIAREIHDNVGHMLSRSILMTGAMKMASKDSSMETYLSQMEETLNAAMTNIRESVHDLHDDSLNLKETLEEITHGFTFCSIHLHYDMGFDIPREIKYCFITIIKEALNNIIRHSNATCVHLIVREHPGLYQLAVEDNGTDIHIHKKSGLGLTNMQDRIQTLRGTIQIYTEKGFRIFITIPKKEH